MSLPYEQCRPSSGSRWNRQSDPSSRGRRASSRTAGRSSDRTDAHLLFGTAFKINCLCGITARYLYKASAVPLYRGRGWAKRLSLGGRASRSRPRPADVFECAARCSVRAAVNSRALCTARTPQCGPGGSAPDLRGRLKSRYNRSYIRICEENFLYFDGGIGAGRVGIVSARRGRRKTFYCVAGAAWLARSIVVATTDFPIGAVSPMKYDATDEYF